MRNSYGNSSFSQFEADAIIAAWNEGKSAGEVAGLISGCTRNAVIGFVYRVRRRFPGVITRDKNMCKARVQVLSKTCTRILTPPVRRIPPSDKRTPPKPMKPPVANPDQKRRPVGVIEVTGCKYPVDYREKTPGRHLFCNAPTSGGSSWCSYHHDVVMTPREAR